MGDFKNDRFILQWQDKIQLIFRIRPEEIIQQHLHIYKMLPNNKILQ